MTKELKDALMRRLDEATESGDPAAIRQAHTAVDKAMMDCQMKTADRVKDIKAKIDEIAGMVKGAKLMAKVVYTVAGAGGGAVLYRLAEHFFSK